MKLNSAVTIFLILFSIQGFAQPQVIEKSTPFSAEGGYLFPVNPGQPNYLSGTMGEFRETHFHSGIDIRTNNHIGLPVLAAQSGYISRAMVGTAGYGRVLFITHANGETTVYAHLDRYNGPIANFVRQQQYRRKSFEVDLFPQADQFRVERGDTIAFSGNTGGSNGPHLHFEIRDSNNEARNPLKYGFSEITDTQAPIAQKIALRTLDADSRINDRFGRFEFHVYKVGNSYVFTPPILAHGRIGVELLAHDRLNKSPGYCGINSVIVYADRRQIFSQQIESVNFLESRGILTLMDFQTMKTKRQIYNKLYVDDGNSLNYFKGTEQRGIITIGDHDVPVKIELKDSYGNMSEVIFTLKPSALITEVPSLEPMKKAIDSKVYGSTLVVSTKACKPEEEKLTVFSGQEKMNINPAYKNQNRFVYLIHLKTILPDSIKACAGSLTFNLKDLVPSGTDYTHYSSFVDIRFPKNSLYDTLQLTLNHQVRSGSEAFTIGSKLYPLQRNITVWLKPESDYVRDRKAGVYYADGGYNYVESTWENGKLKFNTRELGEYVILRDTLPPAISRLSATRQGARFIVRDKLSGINYIEASINGSWLLMTYDYKTGVLQSDRLDKKEPLEGDFVLKVVDNAGNESVYKQKIP